MAAPSGTAEANHAERVNPDDVVAAGGELQFLTVSPDGGAVAFVGFPAERSGDPQSGAFRVVDLATGQLRSFGDELRSVEVGQFSPDGSRLAYSRAEGAPWYSSHRIFVIDAQGGQGRRATESIDRCLWGAVWMPDGQSLLVGGNDGARVSMWLQPLSGAPSRIDLGALDLRAGYAIPEFDPGEGGGIAFIATEPQRPEELYWLDSVGGAPRRLTDYNAEIAARRLGRVDEITWEGPDGFAGNGILVYPPDFDPAGRYPLVLRIHGGPMSASTKRFSVLDQLLAARGFVVFNPNYRGSNNLGGHYQAAIIHDAGAGPGADVMAGLEAVKRLGFVDESRIAVSGWSYGGHMASWLIGNYPDVWRAAVAGAPVTEHLDSYALADLNTGFGWGFDKHPWSPEGQAEWRAQSPIAHVHEATTPTLILCNTGDLRVPITESYKLYHALDDVGTPVRFVAYPVPGHFPKDPVHQRDVYRRWCDWIEQRFSMPRSAPAR